MKKTQRYQTRGQSLYQVGAMMFLICMQWISIDSAFVDTAAIGVAIEDKVTLPSRNEATNPLKEPTPSTLQGAFLSSNLTDSNNGSTSTPPADAPQHHFSIGGDVGGVDGGSTTAAAAADETVWNVRTAAVATLPVDNPGHNASLATAAKSDPATTTDQTSEPWENVVHISSTEEQSSSPSMLSALPTDGTTTLTAGVDYGEAADSPPDKNLMDNMLKSWFNSRPSSAAVSRRYYAMAKEYLQQKDGTGGDRINGRALDGVIGERVIGGPGEIVGEQFKMKPSSKGSAATVVGNNKNLFERWDEASEEQEHVLEDTMRSERPIDVDDDRSSSVLAADQNTPSRWFVLLLSGNSTVAQMRRTDFAKYLKLNLAARLSLEYDEVKINRVLVVPPRLMVNVSVVPISERASAAAAAVAAAAAAASSSSSQSSSVSDLATVSDRIIEDDDPLHNLVETNATLMELSGEEYRVERFMSLKSQKPQSMEESAALVSNRHTDIDFFIYATVGPLCFVVVLGFLLLMLYKYVRKHPVQWPWKRKFRHPSFWPGGRGGDHHHAHRHRRMTDECCSVDCANGGGRCDMSSVDEMGGGGLVNVIYSGEFEQSQQQQLSGSWLDDASFVPDDSLDRIRTPTLLRTPPAAKNKTFTDMLQQCSDGNGDGVGGAVDDHAGRLLHHHNRSSRNGHCAAAVAVHHAQCPRLSRDNKLRILGCKQSCLLLPAVQPATVDNNMATKLSPSGSSEGAACENDNDLQP